MEPETRLAASINTMQQDLLFYHPFYAWVFTCIFCFRFSCQNFHLEYEMWGYVDYLSFICCLHFCSILKVLMIFSGLWLVRKAKTLSSSKPTPKWTRAKNLVTMKVELTRSEVALPHVLGHLCQYLVPQLYPSSLLFVCSLFQVCSLYTFDPEFPVGGGV